MKFLISTLLILSFLPALGQEDSVYYDEDDYEYESKIVDPENLNSTNNYKTETITIKKFDSKKWKEVVGNKNFEEKPLEPKPSNGPRIPSIPWGGGVIRMLSYIIILAAIVAIVLLIAKNTSLDSRKVRKASTPANIKVQVEDINTIDFDSWLQNALATGDFKLAVRVYYLMLLRNLDYYGKIKWKKNKTNLDYLYELLTNNFYYHEIKRITLAYEVVWYGDLPLTKHVFDQIVTEFDSINKAIKPIQE